jgi:hypothetical protein
VHALLFRKWKDRVKGRDWFDFEWYVRNGIKINLDHLKARAIDSGDWPKGQTFGENDLMSLLNNKIDVVSFDLIREDVIKFIPDARVLDIWSAKYFHDIANHLKFQSGKRI